MWVTVERDLDPTLVRAEMERVASLAQLDTDRFDVDLATAAALDGRVALSSHDFEPSALDGCSTPEEAVAVAAYLSDGDWWVPADDE